VLDRRPRSGRSADSGAGPHLPVGSVFEICPAGTAIARELGTRPCRIGGAAVIADYGHPRSAAGETLQAVRRHAFVRCWMTLAART
jgi:NADH dehydrogenase [ubiquinone] 1 alpha subcomplex assembly factor 7